MADEVCAWLARFRFNYSNEDELQQGIVGALEANGWEPAREVRLGGAGRIDMLLGRIGIEVKVKGPKARVTEQLARYAACDELDALVLVTTRHRHRDAPLTLHGKPLHIVRVGA